MRYNFQLDPYIHDFYDPFLAAVSLVVIGIVLFIVLVFVIILIIGRWMLFEKAGQAGWKAIIPIYKNWVYTVDVCKCHWAVFLCEELIIWGFLVTIIFLKGAGGILLILIRMIKNYNLALKTHQSPTSYVCFGLIPFFLHYHLNILKLLVCDKTYKAFSHSFLLNKLSTFFHCIIFFSISE